MKEVIYMYVKGAGWVPERENSEQTQREWSEWYRLRLDYGRYIRYNLRSISYVDGI